MRSLLVVLLATHLSHGALDEQQFRQFLQDVYQVHDVSRRNIELAGSGVFQEPSSRDLDVGFAVGVKDDGNDSDALLNKHSANSYSPPSVFTQTAPVQEPSPSSKEVNIGVYVDPKNGVQYYTPGLSPSNYWTPKTNAYAASSGVPILYDSVYPSNYWTPKTNAYTASSGVPIDYSLVSPSNYLTPKTNAYAASSVVPVIYNSMPLSNYYLSPRTNDYPTTSSSPLMYNPLAPYIYPFSNQFLNQFRPTSRNPLDYSPYSSSNYYESITNRPPNSVAIPYAYQNGPQRTYDTEDNSGPYSENKYQIYDRSQQVNSPYYQQFENREFGGRYPYSLRSLRDAPGNVFNPVGRVPRGHGRYHRFRGGDLRNVFQVEEQAPLGMFYRQPPQPLIVRQEPQVPEVIVDQRGTPVMTSQSFGDRQVGAFRLRNDHGYQVTMNVPPVPTDVPADGVLVMEMKANLYRPLN